MTNLKIYISGKITGDDGWRDKFQRAANEVRQVYPDASILTPLMVDVVLDYEDYMDIDMAMVRVSNMLVMLPDWTDSPGAKREHEYALSLGKKIVPFELIKSHK